ncbi:MAG: 50S ribosomal protein L19e [Candidatus Micrarchaeota archaeon]
MAVHTVRRVAADILGVGTSRIRILDAKAANEALTREDVRGLIKDKVVIVLPKQGVSRGKARITQSRKHAGRGRGEGSKKGARYAGVSRKELWMRKVRALRKTLRNNKFRTNTTDYREMYRMVSGNAFKGKKQLLEFITKKSETEK